jgi:hypothetical protein
MPLNAQTLDPFLADMLKIGSGLFWTLAYLFILRVGRKDKTYGMPLVALCANVSWEFIFSFVIPHSRPQLFIDYVWLFFDLGIVIQYLTYGKKEFPRNLPTSYFYPSFLLALSLAFLCILLLSHELDDKHGIYAAFAQNFMMSILFVFLLLKRNSSKGQSLYIALSKMVGTLIPSILFYLTFPKSYFLVFLYMAIFIFDTIYFLLLFKKLEEEGVNPWSKM